MIIELAPEIETRLNSWSITTNEPPEKFVKQKLEEALEDWEDYTDALKICELVNAGKMKTHSLEEVERLSNEMDEYIKNSPAVKLGSSSKKLFLIPNLSPRPPARKHLRC